MRKRYVVLGLSVVLALALAVPAFGGPTNPLANLSAKAKGVANKALKTAKAAQKTATAASSAAAGAQSSANSAQSTANSAQGAAAEAKKKAETAQSAATGAQNTANGAQGAASGAQGTANTALSTANTAKTKAEEALASANSSLKATEFESGTATESNTTAFKIAAVECTTGQAVTGGGFSIGGEAKKVTVINEGSAFYGPGWLVSAEAIQGQTPTWSLQAIAVCAHP